MSMYDGLLLVVLLITIVSFIINMTMGYWAIIPFNILTFVILAGLYLIDPK